jgi:hypothetical protein
MAPTLRPSDKTQRCNVSLPWQILESAHNISHPGFSPHEAHAHQAFFGWILPTIRTSEFTILQIVGLDAAVVSQPIFRVSSSTALTCSQLLNFFKMSFYLFSVCSIFAMAILMPVNLKVSLELCWSPCG